MTDLSKIKPSHTQRAAVVTFASRRQAKSSTTAIHRPASYALADKACQTGLG